MPWRIQRWTARRSVLTTASLRGRTPPPLACTWAGPQVVTAATAGAETVGHPGTITETDTGDPRARTTDAVLPRLGTGRGPDTGPGPGATLPVAITELLVGMFSNIQIFVKYLNSLYLTLASHILNVTVSNAFSTNILKGEYLFFLKNRFV